jgi:hypothetical protein
VLVCYRSVTLLTSPHEAEERPIRPSVPKTRSLLKTGVKRPRSSKPTRRSYTKEDDPICAWNRIRVRGEREYNRGCKHRERREGTGPSKRPATRRSVSPRCHCQPARDGDDVTHESDVSLGLFFGGVDIFWGEESRLLPERRARRGTLRTTCAGSCRAT